MNYASLFPAPDSDEARRTTVFYGEKCYESSKSLIQDGSLRKMSKVLLVSTTAWYSRQCALIWRASATPSNRLLFQLVPKVRRIEEIGFGLLPTMAPGTHGRGMCPHRGVVNALLNGEKPQAQALTVDVVMAEGLKRQGVTHVETFRPIAFLKTPTTTECEGGVMEIREGANAHYKLRDQIAMLPTPTQRDYKGARKPETLAKAGRNSQTNSLEDAMVGKKTGLKLQPAFVEWLMGYPDKWTELID